MSPSWALLLLCSLLSPSQGFRLLPPAAQENVEGIGQAVLHQDLPQPRASLLGGDLLSGLLGKDGAVGSLLGKDGAVGGLLGKDGAVGSLLGKDGAVGGLLGKDGPVGTLLGKDGVVGGLLGKDGAVGSLLGKDGVVGGLLGKDGPVGTLLGKDGAVGGLLGGLLGKDGAVGSLLGKDGVVGGLLGKDGPVGTLLGKDGVVGGLLGKDGAVGGLLGGLLGKDGAVGSLLGKDGPVGTLLGKDGVVGGLLGKDGAVGSLLGKDGVVGGLLGKDGPVGTLLGKDGVVGGLLGKDGAVGGLLGKDGAVGSLLGKDGVVGGLLGGDGAVGGLLGGLLGKDGAVGSLLGKDGVVGGLLGKDGAVGSLLGKDGVVGGLLGGDGLLGGLLGKEGAVGGLLGGLLDREGVLGGLLGKGGLVDALLGKDGLVDTLLDALLNLLIGKGGILSKDGLVGGLLGGSGGELPGPRIVNNSLPRLSLRSLPGFGHQLGFSTQLLVESTSATGQQLCLQVEADVELLVQDRWAAPQGTRDCQVVDIKVHLRPEVPLLDEPLKHLLADALRGKVCDILSARLRVLNSLLSPRTPALPLGALGDLPPFSIISGDSVRMELNLPAPARTSDWITARDAQGSVVSPAEQNPLPATLLLTAGRPPRLSLSRQALSALLGQGWEQGAFNQDITSSEASSDAYLQGQVPNSLSLSTAALFPLIPQLSRILPGALPLELRLRVAKEPEVAIRGQGATATLKASIDFVVPALQNNLRPLFSVEADIVLDIIPVVQDGRLRTSLALDSISLTRVPQSLDPVSVSSLAGWMKQVLASAYLPDINDALSVAIPLPNVINASFRNVQADFTEAEDFTAQTSLQGSCSGGSLSRLLL